MGSQNRFHKVFGGIFAAIGVVFLVIFGIMFVISQTVPDKSDFWVAGLALAINGAVFTVIGLCFILYGVSKKKKALRLMNEGICYNAEITRVYENLYTRINYRHPLIVECFYTDKHGKTCLVKSESIWPDNVFHEDDLTAKVWVNPDNPQDYYVEVGQKNETASQNKKFDNDYR